MNNAVIALLLCATALFALLWWRAKGAVGRNNRRRQRTAQVGESEAERLLEANGFRILERQVTTTWVLSVDGEAQQVRCRADLLVESSRHVSLVDGCQFIAEVKTGELAPNPSRPATRRQLLEYRMAFDVDGVLLVDMEQRSIHHVTFPESS